MESLTADLLVPKMVDKKVDKLVAMKVQMMAAERADLKVENLVLKLVSLSFE